MRSRRILWCVALPAVFLLSACGRDGPTAPGLYTLSGHVKLTGYMVTPAGDFAGTRVIGDADGVLVELAFGNEIVGRTTTVDGVYSFHGLRPGAYTARTAGIDPIYDETNVLTIVRSDLFAADTLRLAAMGDHLFPVPNPVGYFTTIYFDLRDTLQVNMRVDDLAGNPVRHILAERMLDPGLKVVGWNARDDRGQSVTGAMYWLRFQGKPAGCCPEEAGIDYRIQLLFR